MARVLSSHAAEQISLNRKDHSAPVDLAEIDVKLLKSILTPACRLAFAEIRARYDGESYYCMGLLTLGLLGWLAPTAMTEEGLDRVVRRYQALPAFATESAASLRAFLRWNPSDSALREVGLDHFTEVNILMAQISETLAAIDIHHGWGEFFSRARLRISPRPGHDFRSVPGWSPARQSSLRPAHSADSPWPIATCHDGRGRATLAPWPLIAF